MIQVVRHGEAQLQGAAANAYNAVTRVAAVGMIVAAAIAATDQPVRAEAALLSAEGPLSGSETALILGGTTEPTPSPEFARTAEDLYLHPLGFDDGATGSMVCDMTGTDPCSAPLQVLTTPELLQQGPSSLTGASDVVLAVENEFAAHPGAFDAEHPLTIFGYSQSATAESIAMSRLADAGIPSEDLHFVFIGDPSLPGTGLWSGLESAMDATLGTSLTNFLLNFLDLSELFGNVTPNDLYPATIYSLADDPVPNFESVYEKDGFWAALPNILGPHGEYLGLTPEQVADSTTTTNGDLTYVDINSGDINGIEALLNAFFAGGLSNSGLLESVFQSLELLFTNAY